MSDPGHAHREQRPSTLRVGLAQLAATEDPEYNLTLVEQAVAGAAAAGVRLLVCPEATMVRFGVKLAPHAQGVDGPWAQAVGKLAEQAGLAIVAGMFTPAGDGRVYNSLLFADGAGGDGAGSNAPPVEYRKIHLFDAYGFAESDTVAPGERPVVVTVDGHRIGLATCYDVRFPGLFTHHARAGAIATVLAACWGAGSGKIEQWQTLVRARALDSTSYLLAAAAADPASLGRDYATKAPTGAGHSMAVDPAGQVLGELGTAPGLLVTEVDPEVSARTRRTIPVLDNARF